MSPPRTAKAAVPEEKPVKVSTTDCIFCRMVLKEVPTAIIAETHFAFIIKDKKPAAAHHVLVISKIHVSNVIDATDAQPVDPDKPKPSEMLEPLRGVLRLATAYAKKNLPDGFRIVINTGDEAGQTVKHFHVHILGGEKLKDI